MLEIKEDRYANCISCNDKTKLTKEITIRKHSGTYAGQEIITFNLCYECLNRLAKEFIQFM